MMTNNSIDSLYNKTPLYNINGHDASCLCVDCITMFDTPNLYQVIHPLQPNVPLVKQTTPIDLNQIIVEDPNQRYNHQWMKTKLDKIQIHPYQYRFVINYDR